MNARRSTAALLEVLGVYLAGQLVVTLLTRVLSLQPVNPLTGFTAEISDAELITATRQLFVLLMLQYVGWFLLIIPINWWQRRRGPAAYGLTRAGHSWTALLVAGLATTALATWPVFGVGVVNAIHPLGETVPWREALGHISLYRWQFWLFMAVLSWALPPIVEELFFRGYCQRRLAEDWGDGPAIVGVACLFTFTHSQYWILNAYNVSLLVSLLITAIGFGVVFAWTRSLIPSMLAHAIINFPMRLPWQVLLLTALLIGAAVMRRRGVAVIKQVFSGSTVAGCVALAVVGTGYAIAGARIERLAFVAAGMVVAAIGLEAMDRRRDRAAAAV